ncbi:MAG TPA: MFS transporter, partial [Acidimicrobiales bacterium]|nr:MFS transporter [Acidimicrobiales bacterium]
MQTTTAPPRAPAVERDPRRWIVLGVMCLSLLLIVMDNTIVNVALPTLQRDLGASTSELQWVVDSYILVFAGLLLTMGSLGDRFGRRGALAIGLTVMGSASVASAFATDASHLIATRAIMGIGAALIMPATLSILTNVFTDRRERAQAIAIWSATAGVAVAIGPVTGGWLLEHFWWGSVFLVNVPVVVVALVLGQLFVPTSRDPAAPRVDLLGAGLSIVGLVALVWAIIEGAHGWTEPAVLAAFGAAAVLLAAFIAWERHTATPMLDMSFFADARFSAASGALMLTFFAMMGSLFLLTQFLQSVMGYTALQAGIRLLPMAAVQMVVAPLSAKVVERVGSKVVVTTGLLLGAGGLLLASRLEASASYGQVVVALMVLALGLALVMPPATESIMGSLPPAKAGVGSAVNDTTREVG